MDQAYYQKNDKLLSEVSKLFYKATLPWETYAEEHKAKELEDLYKSMFSGRRKTDTAE